MSKNAIFQRDNMVVFLSATGEQHKADDEIGALTPFLGSTIIEHQIKTCEAIGLKRFYIAVDAVSGSIARIIEKVKSRGLHVDIVMAGVESGLVLDSSERLLLMARGLLVSGNLLEQQADMETPFYLTVDGREENRRFETIDLNHRWAGVALLPGEMLDEVDELPDGWELHSALLRRAVQTGIVGEQLDQDRLQQGDLALPINIAEAKFAEAQILSRIASGVNGAIEVSVFTPIARSILLKFQNYSFVSLFGEISGPIFGFLGFILALLMHPVPACAALLIGIFLSQAGYIAKRAFTSLTVNRVTSRLALDWLATGTIFTLALKSGNPMSIFPAITSLLILSYSRRTDLSGFQPIVLLSPALGIFLLGFAASVDMLPVVIGLIPIGQLVFLIFGKGSPAPKIVE